MGWRKDLTKKYKLTVGGSQKYYEGFTDCLKHMDTKLEVYTERLKVMEHLRRKEKLEFLNKKQRKVSR